MIKYLSLLLILLVFGDALFCQEIIYEHYESGVDFWIVIPYSAFSFKKGSDTAEYQVSLQVNNAKKKQVASFSQTIPVPKRSWLSDTAIPLQFSAKLEPGNYSAVLRIKNKVLGDKRNFKKTFQVDPDYTEIGTSWIIAQKEGISFIPYSLGNLPQNLEQLNFRQGFSLSMDSLRIQIDNNKLMITNTQNPINLDIRQYLKPEERNQMKLTIYEKNIQYNLEPFLYSPWYSYSLRYPVEDQIAQLRYIASQNEWQALRSIPSQHSAQAIEDFWRAQDPSPGTIRNETRDKFYQRVLNADEKFTVHKKMKGWASDRGRIYIKYGEPDEMSSDVYPLGRYPSIVWTYYKQNLVFIFLDVQGYGQYTLRNKENEIEN